MRYIRLVALVVSVALPLAVALAQTGEAEVAAGSWVEPPSAAALETTPIAPASLGGAPAEEPVLTSPPDVPAASPLPSSAGPVEASASAPVVTSEAVVTAAEPPSMPEPATAAVVPPAAEPTVAVASRPAPQSIAAPLRSKQPAHGQTASKATKAKAKVAKARAIRAVRVVNRSGVPVTAVTITAEAKLVSRSGPLAPMAEAVLKLPRIKSCRVTVATAEADGALSDRGEVDLCKVRLVHLTN